MVELIEDLLDTGRARKSNKKNDTSNEKQLASSDYYSSNSKKGTGFFESLLQKLVSNS